MKKISKIVTVSLLTEGIQSSHASFGRDAEDAFPETPIVTVFFDDNNSIVAIGDPEIRLESALSRENTQTLKRLAPFLSGQEALDWFFNPDDVPVSDEFRPDSQDGISVCFNWSGDARDLEDSLMEEEPDDWEDEIETFQSMLNDPNTLAIGWKYVRECAWSVNSNEELSELYDRADWDAVGECCFVVQRY